MKNPLGVPEVVVDRSVNQYFQQLDLDPAQVQAAYQAIPLEDKPPLEDCRIYFSALAAYGGPGLIYGHSQRERKSDPFDKLAPPSDIVIFLGSFLVKDFDDSGSIESGVNYALGHELFHYAQDLQPEEEASTEERKVSDELALTSPRANLLRNVVGYCIKTGILAAVNHVTEFGATTPVVLAGGVAAQVASNHASRPRRRKRREAAISARLQLYNDSPHEEEAYGYEPNLNAIRIKEVPANDRPKPLVISSRSAAVNAMTNITHKQSSLGTPIPRK